MPRLSFEAEPAKLAVDTETAALIIIDMQRDFLEPGGFGDALGNDVSLLHAAVAPCRDMLDAVRGLEIRGHSHARRPPARSVGCAAAQGRARRSPKSASARPARWAASSSAASRATTLFRALSADGEPVIDKPGKGAFYADRSRTDAAAIARSSTLFVTGVTTEVCVNTTVREANDRGFRCIVLADCCASYFPEFHETGLKMIKAQGGIFGWVVPIRPSSMRCAALPRERHASEAQHAAPTGASMMTAQRQRISNLRLWTPGDWNAFFGFGTNILVNMLTLTGLLRFVLQMPDAIVFGRILPATGPDDVPVDVLLRLSGLSAGEENRPQRCLRAAVGHQRAAHVHRHLRDHAADHAQDQRPDQGLGSRSCLGVLPELHPDGRRLHRARSSARSRRAPRCSARSPASPSPSSPCARRWKCS